MNFAGTGSKAGTMLVGECDLFCASYNISCKGFYFEAHFEPEFQFLQVDDGLTHMLDEVFDERCENMAVRSRTSKCIIGSLIKPY